jgi:hypothetical protein
MPLFLCPVCISCLNLLHSLYRATVFFNNNIMHFLFFNLNNVSYLHILYSLLYVDVIPLSSLPLDYSLSLLLTILCLHLLYLILYIITPLYHNITFLFSLLPKYYASTFFKFSNVSCLHILYPIFYAILSSYLLHPAHHASIFSTQCYCLALCLDCCMEILVSSILLVYNGNRFLRFLY